MTLIPTGNNNLAYKEIARLKAENAKLQESNNAMAELLKEIKNDADDFALEDLNSYYSDKITKVLTAAGHKV